MTEGRPLDDLYFTWLYQSFVGSLEDRNPEHSYWQLAEMLYKTPFTWVILDDANRAEDGKELRELFIKECDIQDIEINWLQLECSVLEMMIGLAARCSFESLGTPGDWFMKFMDNLGIRKFNDHAYIYDPSTVDEVTAIIQRLLDRTYEKDGVGGLFPCNNASRDQTQTNLWYQAQGYLLEDDRFERGP